MRAIACLLGVTGLALAGCVSAPDLPPVVDISDRSCAQAPDMSLAVPVGATIAGSREKPTVRMVAPDAPCIGAAGGKSLYAIFELPNGGPYTVSVTSVALGRSIMAPRTSVLHADGSLAHEIPVDSFFFRGTNLTALFRTHPGDHYVVVASDTASVGHAIARISESVNVNVIYAGSFYGEVHTGNDVLIRSTWSHTGEVDISVVADKVP